MGPSWLEDDREDRTGRGAQPDCDTDVDFGLVVIGEEVVEVIDGVEAEEDGALDRRAEKPTSEVEFQ